MDTKEIKKLFSTTKVVTITTFRSKPFVNMTEDMCRITIDVPIHSKLKQILQEKKNETLYRN